MAVTDFVWSWNIYEYGWVRLTKTGEMLGQIAFHAGDVSEFKAARFAQTATSKATNSGEAMKTGLPSSSS